MNREIIAFARAGAGGRFGFRSNVGRSSGGWAGSARASRCSSQARASEPRLLPCVRRKCRRVQWFEACGDMSQLLRSRVRSIHVQEAVGTQQGVTEMGEGV